MKRGIVHHKDSRRTYLKVHTKHLAEHKHLFPGKEEWKIVPALRKKHHDLYQEGDKVNFTINSRNKIYQMFLYFSIPVFTIVVGFILVTLFTRDVRLVFKWLFLFMVLGILIKLLLERYVNIFRDINVLIHKPSTKVLRARKKK